MDFDDFLEELAATARRRPDVIGLAGFGSTADRTRVDEWSDHDFAWITIPGAEERYRRSRDWLPAPERIAMHVVEHHGGVKVIYDDGHLAEFGVASLENLATWETNRGVALVDDGGLEAALTASARHRGAPVVPADEVALALSAILVGVGRARRGERLSGGSSVRGAAQHILRALGATSPDSYPPLDALDPHRRVEQVHPGFAADLSDALERPLEECGRRMLDLAERLAADDPQVRATAHAVRRRLGW